jgi:3-dehydroquinate synthase
MKQIRLKFLASSSDIIVGLGAYGSIRDHLDQAGLSGSLLVVSQSRVLDAVGLAGLSGVPVVTIPNGERAKTVRTVSRLIDRMVSGGLTRESIIVAVGGGVVGDVAGFAASIYLRGIRIVQVPTTLLAQVDSSVGGKTGVNHASGKNLIGTFHQPRLVVADPLLLQSLPKRDYVSGLYEALKYGVIRDREQFELFETNRESILDRRPEEMERLVTRSLRSKAAVVAADEREGNVRRILNFGHTLGHAIETAAGYRRIRHGEAVGYGMIGATRIARKLGRISRPQADRIEAAVVSLGRLPRLQDLSPVAIAAAMQHDKKIRSGTLHFVLPRRVGRVEINSTVTDKLVREVLGEILEGPPR